MNYSLLGSTGLRVSPVALGTLRFGKAVSESSAKEIFRRYLDAGGNFIDTADAYGNGESERILGRLMRDSGREQVVVATKFTRSRRDGDPNAAGNGRKNMVASLEASLQRLRTDYVDLYWLHAWDGITPVEEVVTTFHALVGAGKARAVGFSNVPAWYAAKAQTLAMERGLERIAALQMEYSLLERTVEREHLAAARDLNMGLVAWAPLGGGILGGGGRTRPKQKGDQHEERISSALAAEARRLGCSPARLALAWLLNRPGVAAAACGPSSAEQLVDLMGAIELRLEALTRERLDSVSHPSVGSPYWMFEPDYSRERFGGGLEIGSAWRRAT